MRFPPDAFDILKDKARLLPVEKRDVFLQRIGAVLLRRSTFDDDDVVAAVKLALRESWCTR